MVTNREIRKQMHDLQATIHKTSDLEYSFHLSVSVTDIDDDVFDDDWFGDEGEKKLHEALAEALTKELKDKMIFARLDLTDLESKLEEEEEEFDHLDDAVTAKITHVSANR